MLPLRFADPRSMGASPTPHAPAAHATKLHASAHDKPVTAITINVKAFQGSDGGEVDDRAYTAIAKYIKDSDADVVLFQELDKGTKRAHGQDTLAEISKRVHATDSQFGKAIDYDGGDYGVGILTRNGFSIPDAPDGTNQHTIVKLPKSSHPKADPEQRIALVAPITMPGGGSFTAVTTHAGRTNNGRGAQLDALRGVAMDAQDGKRGRTAGLPDSLPTTVVMGGDFNTHQDTIEGRFRGSGIEHLNRRTSELGSTGIDHIFVSKDVGVKDAKMHRADKIDGGRWWNPFDSIKMTDHPAITAHLLLTK